MNLEELLERKDLTLSEKEVIKTLWNWNFKSFKSNWFNIANKSNMSGSTATLALRKLNIKGIVIKSFGGYWHINEKIKEM